MKYIFIIFTILMTLKLANAQNVETIHWEKMDKILHKNNDTTYIINFWATWCAPCVKELPYFEKISKKYAQNKVKVILVSLDFNENIDNQIIPFLKKKGITSEVVLLDESDPNEWINKVSPKWSGAIPATVIYKKKNYSFYEKQFIYNELDSLVKIKLEN